MPQDIPPTSPNRVARLPAGMARLGGRAIPVVGTALLIGDAISIIDALIPAQTKIGNAVGGLRGQAGDYAWSGEILHGPGNGIDTAQLINQYWGDPSLPMRLEANAARARILDDTAQQIAQQALPDGNMALADALQARGNETIGYINAAVAQGDAEGVGQILADYNAESARQQAEFEALTQAANAAASKQTSETVRVSGMCRPIRICFWPQAKYRRLPLRREYERQLAAQERAINAMSPGQLVSNRDAFCDLAQRPALEAQAAASRSATRAAYRTLLARRYTAEARMLPLRARAIALAAVPARVVATMRSLAALHNPDMIAGGRPMIPVATSDAANVLAGRPIASMGHKGVNNSIGSSWGSCGSGSSRSSRLAEHARRQAANGCPSTQASLEICQG